MSARSIRVLVIFTLAAGIRSAPVEAENLRWKECNDGLISWGIVGLVVDHETSSTLYALTRAQGVYKSMDGGESWVSINDGLPASPVATVGHMFGNLLTIDPNDSGTLYASFGGEVFKYTDVEGGQEWINIQSGIDACSPPAIAGILVDPQDSRHIFAAHIASGCSGGIFESFDADLDAGLTWTQIASWSGSGAIENDAWTLAIDPTNPSRLFCTTPYLGLLYSADGGHYWYRNTPLGEGRRAGTVVVVHPDVTNRIIFGHPLGIHVGTYTVEGEDWIWEWTDCTGSVGGYVWDIDVAKSNTEILYAVTSSGLFRSEDGGWSWSEIGDYGNLFPRSLAIDPGNADVIYLGTGRGMFKSTDGGATLIDITNELPAEMEVETTAIAPSDPETCYCNLDGVGFFRSTNRGRTWSAGSEGGDIARTISILVDRNDPEVVYAGLEKIHKTVDGGAQWTLSLDPERNEQFFDVEMDSAGNLYATSVHTIAADERYAEFYRSTDGGQSWSEPNPDFHHASISAGPIVIDPNGTVYVATYDFVRKSTDGGVTWTKLTSGLTGDPYDRWVDGLAVDLVEPNRLYLCARSHNLFTSMDHGGTWTGLSGEVPLYPGRIIVDPVDHTRFYVFGLFGWRRYTDHGSASEEMPTEGIEAPYTNFRRSALQDPVDPGRFITGDFFQGCLVFDDYVPRFSTSALSVSPARTVPPGSVLTYTASVVNSGTEVGRGMELIVSLPHGVDFVEGSLTVDGATAPETWVNGALHAALGDIDVDGVVTVSYRFAVGLRMQARTSAIIRQAPLIASDVDPFVEPTRTNRVSVLVRLPALNGRLDHRTQAIR